MKLLENPGSVWECRTRRLAAARLRGFRLLRGPTAWWAHPSASRKITKSRSHRILADRVPTGRAALAC